MRKTQDELKQELDRIYGKEYYSQIKEREKYDLYLIKMNCIKNKCPNFDILDYKSEYPGDAFFICYDDWSSCKIGWHVIYCETLDLCFEHKKEEYLKGEIVK